MNLCTINNQSFFRVFAMERSFSFSKNPLHFILYWISDKFPKNCWQTYAASFLLAILARSSKVVEAAMVVAFIIPRVKSTVALRAVGHLAMWLLWRTSGFLANEASDLNLERRGQFSLSSASVDEGMPRRAATSGGGIRNSPVLTVVMNGFLRGPWLLLAPLIRSSSLSLSCSWSFLSFAFRTSLKSSVDSVMLGLMAGIFWSTIDRQSSSLLLLDSLLNGFVWFDWSLDWDKCSFDLLIRLRCSNVGLLLSGRSRITGGLVPSFRRIAYELFTSRTNGSPFAVGANAEIPAGIVIVPFFLSFPRFSTYLVNFTTHFLWFVDFNRSLRNMLDRRLWTAAAVSLRGSKRARASSQTGQCP